MIGYRVSRQTLRNLITKHGPDWLTKAENGERPPWSDVKDVFARIQRFKCGYCERPMPSHKLRRGRIIIDLFGLNLRDDLILQRCYLIRAMWPYLEGQRTGNRRARANAAREIEALTESASQHSNCARCFRALHASNWPAAQGCYQAAQKQSE